MIKQNLNLNRRYIDNAQSLMKTNSKQENNKSSLALEYRNTPLITDRNNNCFQSKNTVNSYHKKIEIDK